MTKKFAVIMDPIQAIHIEKDSTFAILLEAQRRNYEIYYLELADLFIQAGIAYGQARQLTVHDNSQHWFDSTESQVYSLHTFDVIFMRKDPPVDGEYLYATHILELAEAAGALVVNKPQSLRDVNEKLFTSWFPQCCPDTLVTSKISLIREFLTKHKKIVCKPLHGMGGDSVFLVEEQDVNVTVILETLTQQNDRHIMAQQFIPEISAGDKRILLIDGNPIPYALARIPAPGEFRGNLAKGGRGVGVELSERDRWICQQVGPVLREKGLLFVGLDVIGDYLTEINVTSPTCIRQLDNLYSLNISEQLLDVVERGG